MTNDDLRDRPLDDLERRIAASAPRCDSTVRDAVLFQAGLAAGRRAGRRLAFGGSALASAASIVVCLAGAYWTWPTVIDPGARTVTNPALVAAAAPGPRKGAPIPNVAGADPDSPDSEGMFGGPPGPPGPPTPPDVEPPRADDAFPVAADGVWRAGMNLADLDL